MKVGDKVRIINVLDPSGSKKYDFCIGQTGIITSFDDVGPYKCRVRLGDRVIHFKEEELLYMPDRKYFKETK